MIVISFQVSPSVERLRTSHDPTYRPVSGSRRMVHGAMPVIVITFSILAIVCRLPPFCSVEATRASTLKPLSATASPPPAPLKTPSTQTSSFVVLCVSIRASSFVVSASVSNYVPAAGTYCLPVSTNITKGLSETALVFAD
jgi:hypothetical protein